MGSPSEQRAFNLTRSADHLNLLRFDIEFIGANFAVSIAEEAGEAHGEFINDTVVLGSTHHIREVLR